MKSIRQQRKEKRTGQIDRYGFSMTMSRRVRRGLRRISISTNAYNNSVNRAEHTKPGSIKYH